jgi:hypothetical protein
MTDTLQSNAVYLQIGHGSLLLNIYLLILHYLLQTCSFLYYLYRSNVVKLSKNKGFELILEKQVMTKCTR